jgi:hypothetical protein
MKFIVRVRGMLESTSITMKNMLATELKVSENRVKVVIGSLRSYFLSLNFVMTELDSKTDLIPSGGHHPQKQSPIR